mmetsp:Transcript_24140/g.29725  ORF Transcript_24140/g.29725 Transcript_24140/m.29725 type:complete len:269 (-) Transcript_24140:110-916(-)
MRKGLGEITATLFFYLLYVKSLGTSAALSLSPMSKSVQHDRIGLLSEESFRKKIDVQFNIENQDNARISFTRRKFGTVLQEMMVLSTVPSIVHGEDETLSPDSNSNKNIIETVLLKGSVTIPAGISLPEDTTSSALYITARPNNSIDVPRAILDGSNGKPPPVLAARFPNLQFPFNFELRASDLTLEGNNSISTSTTTVIASEGNNYWWEGKDLIVSARWDTDGVAATRDPTDLVGRGLLPVGDEKVSIQLQGRGLTGKLVTGKSPKK